MAGLLPLMIQLQFVASSGRILASTSARRSEYNIEQWVEPSPQLYIYIYICVYIYIIVFTYAHVFVRILHTTMFNNKSIHVPQLDQTC